MISIETERLYIRNFTTDDLHPLQTMIVWYQESDVAAYDHPWPVTEQEIHEIIQWFASGDHFLAVCLKASARFIGFVSLNPEEDDSGRMFNLGYIFDPHYHGHGYASEACRAVLISAFGHLNALRVVSGAAVQNRNSCRLLERLGFRKTGENTGSFTAAEDGRPLEFLGYLYELTKEDWAQRQPVPESG